MGTLIRFKVYSLIEGFYWSLWEELNSPCLPHPDPLSDEVLAPRKKCVTIPNPNRN